ncbi:putative cytosolic prostaglandin-E synthase [Monocercomonoides exilis]|uniref:putative cytosolic prostaglandin-E synthase n=1 Tax=Monocercomonoides exilis TaxID=2049356 RepID=UPI00355A907C|nr:putative cytosolic prostaglandin-E synthase [Monocercomonoides exilis]
MEKCRKPDINWAQRHTHLFLSYVLPSLEKETANIQVTSTSIHFTAIGDSSRDRFDFVLDLYDEIDSDNYKMNVTARGVSLFIMKKEEKWWPRLNKEGKLNNIKIDWDKWREEDDPEIPGVDFPFEVPDPEDPESDDN